MKMVNVECIDLEVEHEIEEREGTEDGYYSVEKINVYHKGEDITVLLSNVMLNKIKSQL